MDTGNVDTSPGFLNFECMMKATPAQEGRDRFIYIEASNEGRDQQNEIVLAKALDGSVDHFLKFGRLDIDHKSMPTIARKLGIEVPEAWEIGVPVEARVDGKSTFVKARLYQGDTHLADRANMVWDSMTKLTPPKKWYPSVGGMPLAKSVRIDPDTGERIDIITKVRWSNLALTSEPVNQHVSGVATVPFGALAKSWVASAGGFDLAKALTASYATDSAMLTGADAIRGQSLDGVPSSYFNFRERLAGALKSGRVKEQTDKGLVKYCTGMFSLSHDEATEWVSRFLADLKSGLKQRSS